jgi:UDP-2,3-diacylglucosamine pyrophosphatase LpxH
LINIRIVNEWVHTTADSKTLWITHGDLYDVVIRYHRWLAYLGDRGYDFLLWLNRHFNWLRGKFGAPYWSLSAYVKNRVKQALEFIDSFEETLARECASRGYDGVVCGHIHKAVMKTVGGVLYCNDGDWVESCTALVEHDDGRLEIIQWHIVSHEGAAKAATAAAVIDSTAEDAAATHKTTLNSSRILLENIGIGAQERTRTSTNCSTGT